MSDPSQRHADYFRDPIAPSRAPHGATELLATRCRPAGPGGLGRRPFLVRRRASVRGHHAPSLAPVAAIVGIDLTVGQRLRRAIELIVGASVGVGVGALLIAAIGTGPWQIALIVALATSVAVLLHGRAVINVQAAISAILVATLYVPGDTTGTDRLIDGLIGAAIGLVIDAVFARSSVCGPAIVVTGPGARGGVD